LLLFYSLPPLQELRLSFEEEAMDDASGYSMDVLLKNELTQEGAGRCSKVSNG
jgi:hypothetical protein